MAISILRGGKTSEYKPDPQTPYQRRVYEWIVEAFGEKVAKNKRQRALRFVEEAIELAQALGISEREINAEAKKVFGAPAHPAIREVGGVMTTIAGVCEASGFDMFAIAEMTLVDNYHRMAEIRIKQQGKST